MSRHRARRLRLTGSCDDRLCLVNTSKQVGDVEHIKVFANQDAAEKWFEENDPEGMAFEYEVLE
jgi:hypothetical protein